MEDHEELEDNDFIEDRVKEEKFKMKDPVLEGVIKQNLRQRTLLIWKDIVNVLIVYTGGSFGMMKTADGYVPK